VGRSCSLKVLWSGTLVSFMPCFSHRVVQKWHARGLLAEAFTRLTARVETLRLAAG